MALSMLPVYLPCPWCSGAAGHDVFTARLLDPETTECETCDRRWRVL